MRVRVGLSGAFGFAGAAAEGAVALRGGAFGAAFGTAAELAEAAGLIVPEGSECGLGKAHKQECLCHLEAFEKGGRVRGEKASG